MRRLVQRLGQLRSDVHLMEVLRGSAVAFVVRGGHGVAALGFNLLLARYLGAEHTGLYFLAFTVLNAAVVVARMGMDNPLLRLTAQNVASGDWPAVAGVYRAGLSIVLVTAAIITAVLLAGSGPLAILVFNDARLTAPFQVMALGVLPAALSNLYGELLKGLKRILESQFVAGLALMLFALVFLALLGPHASATDASRVLVAAAGVTALVGMLLWRRATPALRHLTPLYAARDLLRASTPLVWAASLTLLGGWTATFVLGVTHGPREVGIFNAALRAATATSLALIAVNSISAPKFAALYRQQAHAELERLARASTSMMTGLVAPVLLLFVIAPRWVMGWFGPEFEGGAVALVLLTLGQFVNVATGSTGYLLLMTGRERVVRNNIAINAVLTIVLDLLLIPGFGVLGAAVATSVGVIALNIHRVLLVQRELGITTIPGLKSRRAAAA